MTRSYSRLIFVFAVALSALPLWGQQFGATKRVNSIAAIVNSKGQQARAYGKRRSAGRFRKSGNLDWPAHTRLLVQQLSREFSNSRQLTGAARQHDPASCLAVEAARRQTVAHQLERFFYARGNNADQEGLRNCWHLAIIILADSRHANDLGLISRRWQASTMQSL